MQVLKFGGTSVGKPERMASLVGLVTGSGRKIVVLSALSGTTDALVNVTAYLHRAEKDKARKQISGLQLHYRQFLDELFAQNTEKARREIGDLVDSHFRYIHGFTLDMFTHHEEKAVLAQGELMSTAIFNAYLAATGHKAVLLNALDFMRTDKDGEPDYFYIRQNLDKLLSGYPDDQLFITQGYICRNVYGEVDNLKRGGSDYSASLIGASLQVDEIQIWTDVGGMRNNDPRVVKTTQRIKQLSFDEAAELAYFGAKILHPSSIRPAKDKRIPVVLKNTLCPDDEGTCISDDNKSAEIKAIAAKDQITAIKIKSGRMLLAHGFLRRVFEVFERYKTSIDMITTSEVAVSVTIDDTSHLQNIVDELKAYGSVEVDREQTIVCVVGDFLDDKKGYAYLVFEALKDVPIRMISYGGSQNNISFLVRAEDKEQTLNALNKNLFGLE